MPSGAAAIILSLDLGLSDFAIVSTGSQLSLTVLDPAAEVVETRYPVGGLLDKHFQIHKTKKVDARLEGFKNEC
ncbi:unnamed protein product [Clonostachys rosea f. rosea IK726]|uniref:Uncharacterized protein n=1 Tax=Clonostachys rosea f. rosea IK726 TaxID=1349383 RepID=A0ACA9UM59_BIOOC|nr:unnamed protein product [Clonostachys rosea f. rosea IK726]